MRRITKGVEGMHHSFEVEIAAKYGIKEAIILQNLKFWIDQNRANERHFHDGLYWTFNSVKAFKTLFPYMTKRQIQSALSKMEEEGLIVTGNYNGSTYDRTKWYALSDKGNSLFENVKCIYPKCEMDLPKMQNGFCTEGKPIPDINTDINTDIYTASKDTVRQTQDVRRCVDAWNSLSDVGIKQVSRVSSGSKRYNNLLARIKEYGVDDVLKAIDKVRDSDFLQGKTKRRFNFTFDWFVLPSNFPKVLEGNYDNDESNSQQYMAPAVDNGGWQ